MTTQSEPTPAPVLPPPRTEVGILGWVLANLFSNRFNSALTIISAAVVVLALWFGLRWVFVDADWRVISTLGGLMFMGPYNTDASCPGNDCFWRPQVSLLLVSVLLGMVWGIAGSPTAKRLALLTSGVLLLLAFLPYSFERMGMDVRLLLAANLPAVGVGWAIAKSPTAMRVSLMAVGTFVLLAFFLYSYEYLGTDVHHPAGGGFAGGEPPRARRVVDHRITRHQGRRSDDGGYLCGAGLLPLQLRALGPDSHRRAPAPGRVPPRGRRVVLGPSPEASRPGWSLGSAP